MNINFYDLKTVENNSLKYAVIITRYKNQWVLVRHRERTTWEIPGGHREREENIYETAPRELFEETGALKYEIEPICIYSVEVNNIESHGQLFYAEVETFGELPNLEIAEVRCFHSIPENLTYGNIQPHLLEKCIKWLKEKSHKINEIV